MRSAFSLLLVNVAFGLFMQFGQSEPAHADQERGLSAQQRTLEDSWAELGRIFGTTLTNLPKLRVPTEAEFSEVGARHQAVTAIYRNGEILLPVSTLNSPQVSSSIRHEAMHAALEELSNGKTPGWIDEGLALLFEGSSHRRQAQHLRKYLSSSPPISLEHLQRGFLGLGQADLEAAYAQSLFAVKSLVNTYGYNALRGFLRSLAAGEAEEEAFSEAFALSHAEFETRLGAQLGIWAANPQAAF